MSIWTHVVGLVYIDDIAVAFTGTPAFHLNEQDIPSGSEGSLTVRRIDNPTPNVFHGEKHYTTRFGLAIWGDLRDFDDVESIVTWLTNLTGDKIMVRDGVVQITVEGHTPQIYRFVDMELDYKGQWERVYP